MHPHSVNAFASQCSICGTMLVGPISIPFRLFGVRRSSRNPNICTRCSTHVEEGRVVEISVLFADLSSFTELTHELGPDQTHQLVDAFLRKASEIIARQNGFIDKFVGDAVMALFNVPVQNEKHAQLAIEAALEIVRSVDALGARFERRLAVSVGIATGFARVGRLGSDDAKDYTAIGEAVNLASRLQGKADAGEIIVNAAAYRSSNLPDSAAHVDRLSVKGFRDPVDVYRMNSGTRSETAETSTESGLRERISLGAIVFALLGAPCAVVSLLGPIAVSLGGASLLGAVGAIRWLDQSAWRLPLLILVTVGAVANAYTLSHAHLLRKQNKVPEHLRTMTTLERQRSWFVAASSAIALGLVAFELIAHSFRH